MSVELEFIQKPSYLHVKIYGLNTEKDIFTYAEEMRKECSKRNCYRLLVEENLQGPRMKAIQVYNVISKISEHFRGIFQQIAYVDINRKDDMLKFEENLANDRGLPLRVFTTVKEAENWLMDTENKINNNENK